MTTAGLAKICSVCPNEIEVVVRSSLLPITYPVACARIVEGKEGFQLVVEFDIHKGSI